MAAAEARELYRRALRAAAALPTRSMATKMRQNVRDAYEFYRRPAFEPRRAALLADFAHDVGVLERLAAAPPDTLALMLRKADAAVLLGRDAAAVTTGGSAQRMT